MHKLLIRRFKYNILIFIVEVCNMNKKIIGIFICMLLLVTTLVPLSIALDEEYDKIAEPVSKGGGEIRFHCSRPYRG